MATIKPIEDRSVHQIQSGQVIVDLNSVAKELVENALDAGATSIEVRFKNSGLDAIEVQDNGSGISPADFPTLALKHYTSKLSTYDDLSSLQTFGFRGEALSSLCALSKFHIITARAEDGPKGTKLEFEQSGNLKGTSVVAAKQGTTVVVENLFYGLPVRRKELEKSIKREYGKVLQLLHAYACISVGVKFSVINQVPKGKRTVAFATQSNPNTKENIANIYGAKTLLALIPLDLSFEMDPSNRPGSTQSARNWSTQEDPGAREVKIAGHISRPVVGEGRLTPDRQMFFVNSRPCELPQVKKAFNEVYKSYNMTQSAFIFADIKIDTNAYDVNISPDKRSIMLHDQTALLEALKDALTALFEGHDQSVPQAQLPERRVSSLRSPALHQQESTDSVTEENSLPEKSKSPSNVLASGAAEKSSESDIGNPHRTGFVKASLLERFAERDTVERSSRDSGRRRQPNFHSGRVYPVLDASDEEDPIAEPSVNTPAVISAEDEGSPIFEPEAQLASESASSNTQELPRAVLDFNARLASQQAKHKNRPLSPRKAPAQDEEEDDDDEDEEQEAIPAIKQTPQRQLSQSTIQNAFDRMRPMRTPAQQATITVGNTTTLTTIGSSPRTSTRSRIHTPKFSLSGQPLSHTSKKPAFLKSLRGFAAPGTQMSASDEEEEDETHNSSMPEESIARSPSPVKRITSERPDESSADEQSEGRSIPAVRTVDEDDTGIPEQKEPDGDEYASDEEYIDETEKKVREEAKIAKMIVEAEEAAARPTETNIKRANNLLQNSRRKHQTNNLIKPVHISMESLLRHVDILNTSLINEESPTSDADSRSDSQLNAANPEERLSLTVTKSDFHNMRIIGQFNLGFILAVRPPTPLSPTPDLFIIDQHASDEKYNFERLSATTVLVSQRLVHPHPLELTAIEEEIILNNEPSLTANGFIVSVDTSGATPVGQRAKLTSLPMSKEVTFTPTDLEELLALLLDNPPSSSGSQYILRPSKVRKLLASRACRSSIMIGKTLRSKQMKNVVRHMGEMDKPWSCPHGRPTMRHLFGLEKWEGWKEGDGIRGVGDERVETDWGGWLKKRKRGG